MRIFYIRNNRISIIAQTLRDVKGTVRAYDRQEKDLQSGTSSRATRREFMCDLSEVGLPFFANGGIFSPTQTPASPDPSTSRLI